MSTSRPRTNYASWVYAYRGQLYSIDHYDDGVSEVIAYWRCTPQGMKRISPIAVPWKVKDFVKSQIHWAH
jgi:hypothetical protein